MLIALVNPTQKCPLGPSRARLIQFHVKAVIVDDLPVGRAIDGHKTRAPIPSAIETNNLDVISAVRREPCGNTKDSRAKTDYGHQPRPPSPGRQIEIIVDKGKSLQKILMIALMVPLDVSTWPCSQARPRER